MNLAGAYMLFYKSILINSVGILQLAAAGDRN